MEKETNTLENTYLSFNVGREYFAVNVRKVLEVLEKQTINQVPNAPSYVSGVINFRGEIITVVEARAKFGLPVREQDSKFVIIVMELQRGDDKHTMGVITDRVRDVLLIHPRDIKPVPKMDNDFDTSFLFGVAQIDEQFLMLLNVDKVFSDSEVKLVQQIVEEQSKL